MKRIYAIRRKQACGLLYLPRSYYRAYTILGEKGYLPESMTLVDYRAGRDLASAR